MRVEHQRRHRVVRVQQLSERRPRLGQIRVFKCAGAEGWRKAGLQQRGVSQRQWRIQFTQPAGEQVAAGPGAAVFYKAHMPLGHAEPQRQLQLAYAARLPRALQGFRQVVRGPVHGAIESQACLNLITSKVVASITCGPDTAAMHSK